ncbi:MAG: hypothetical protein D6738_12275 [Acidobacteria bacterium]|nr:MAG: hypothetical protein D6738_12275 [Acidobacteriota bacterium]
MSETSLAPDLLPLLRGLASLGLVLAVVVVAGWLLRRRIGGGGSGALRIDERLVVSRNLQVLLLRVGSRRLLVGAGERGVSLIAELDPEPAGAPAAPDEAGAADGLLAAAERFRGVLGHALRARRSAP